jgi:uncharacterized protein (TIGR00297 family)
VSAAPLVETPAPVSSEAARKVVHIAMGGFAFALRYLTWPQAAACAVLAFVFNWQVLPRIGGRRLWRRGEHERGRALGILLYPVAVLGLVLLFHSRLWMAATLWGILAFGDGMATMAGTLLGGPRLPWNPRKGWAGTIAFVVFGAAGAAVLAVWTQSLGPEALRTWLPRGLLLALACAWVESLDTTMDDNVTVPLAGAFVLPLLAVMHFSRLLDPVVLRHALVGLAVNVPVAALAWRARSIDVPGAISAVVIGTAITAGLGLPGFAVMMAFFVLGSAATKAGYRIKAARGIAQEKGGARGWRNAWANGGVPALLAGTAGLAYAPSDAVLALAYAAAVATAAADTCSSEVGKAWGRRTFLITSLRPVPPGTEGAVSLEGTVGGLLGGAAVAAVGAVSGLYSWRWVPAIAIAGLLGSLAESVIGTEAEKRGWMDNDLLNALNTAIGAVILVLLVALGIRLR